MTKREFIAKQAELRRAGNRWSAIWLVVFFGGLFGIAGLSSYLERDAEQYRAIGTALGIGLMVFLFVSVGAMLWFGVRQQKRFVHRCPGCNKLMVGNLAQIAVASGHCGLCGGNVFRA